METDDSSADPRAASSAGQGKRSIADFGDPAAEYDAIARGVAVIDLGCRSRIELTGNDRAAFLHNLCTNEIRKLPVGAGCEAYLLNVQGKILAHVLVLNRAEGIAMETVPGAASMLAEHLERYHIREAVEIHDRTAEWGEYFLAGPEAESLVGRLVGTAPPAAHLSSVEVSIADIPVSLWRIDLGSLRGRLLLFAAAQSASLWDVLVSAGARPCGTTALEIARIEAGWPLYGVDISDRNLPQEVDRDAAAISFVKGCYLGQETVARIDALGHVNKLLVGLRFDGSEVPPPGADLTGGGQRIGEVTSACHSPRFGSPLALAYVRRGSHAAGTKLDSAYGACEVVSLR